MPNRTRPHMALIVVATALAVALLSLAMYDGPDGTEPAPEATEAPAAPGGSTRQLVLDPRAEIDLMSRFDAADSDFTSTSVLAGDLEVTDERGFQGERSVVTTVRAPTGFAYARVEEQVDWDEGDEVWYGAAIYLERGFKDAQGDGSVDLLRWDNWPEDPEHTDHGGLAVLSDGTLALFREQLGSEPWTVILGPFAVPEGRWVWLEVRQRFSTEDGAALNEVWMDGRRLGSSTDANHFGRPITRYRVGIIATPDPQPEELRLYLDQAVVARTGPIMRVD